MKRNVVPLCPGFRIPRPIPLTAKLPLRHLNHDNRSREPLQAGTGASSYFRSETDPKARRPAFPCYWTFKSILPGEATRLERELPTPPRILPVPVVDPIGHQEPETPSHVDRPRMNVYLRMST